MSTEKLLKCLDKLLQDHDNSSSCLVLLGNFSTVANLGIYRSKDKRFITKKNPAFSAKSGCFGASEFWFSRRGLVVHSVLRFHSFTVNSCSRSAERRHKSNITTNSYCSRTKSMSRIDLNRFREANQ